jgi:uncharacterized lipoprotein YmbA
MIMIQRIFARALVVVLSFTLLAQAGCAGRSRSASFYVLSPVVGSELSPENIPGRGSNISVGISPVSLPKYLRRQQIVTRTGSNELYLAEYDRWAGKIEEDIGRVIAENLGNLLAADRVFVSSAMEPIEPDYTLEIDISRFDGRMGGDIELTARWAIFARGGKGLSDFRTSHIVEPARGDGYAEMVAAQSRALAAFSRGLAEAIKELAGR